MTALDWTEINMTELGRTEINMTELGRTDLRQDIVRQNRDKNMTELNRKILDRGQC